MGKTEIEGQDKFCKMRARKKRKKNQREKTGGKGDVHAEEEEEEILKGNVLSMFGVFLIELILVQ